ncbi:MAG: glycosyltransferase family 39 protein [Phycisphaerae bacterium]|nr:glycosyltransferase family 39 protein [Phycisphaerae bacterium]
MTSGSDNPAPPQPASAFAWLLVAALLAIHATLAISSLRRKSATFDEVVRLTSGYSYWVTGDYRLDPAEPPLAQMWAGLPLLAGDYRFSDLDQPAWWISDAESIGRQFFFGLGNDTTKMLTTARVMIVLLSVALGLLVYVWSRRLFGPVGGMISLVLYAFSPNLLAHARLVTTETATCLFFVASLGGLWWVLQEVRPLSVLLSAAALAGLFLSKMSAPLLIPVGVALLAVRLISSQPLQVRLRGPVLVRRRWARLSIWLGVIVVQIVVVVSGMWAVHRFRYEGMVRPVEGRDRYCPPVPIPPSASSWDHVLANAGTIGRVVSFCREHRLLPEAYLYGVAFQYNAIGAGYGFLNGERRISGWWYFFLYCLAVKTPLPLFAILALAGAAGVRRWTKGSTRAAPDSSITIGLAAIGLFMAVYWIVALRSSLNIGHRHILPTYPFMFILAGGVGLWWKASARRMRAAVLACIGMFVLAAVSIWPNYLAYFNWLIGGPSKAYAHLVDSSLDWGQDLPGVGRWLKAHKERRSESEKIYLSYFGTDDPERFGIEAVMLPSHMAWRPAGLEALGEGTYCISATMLQLMYIMPTNEWTETFEAAYQLLKPEFDRPMTSTSAPAVPADEVEAFRLLRFARLCAGLRRRTPTDQIGYSILVYELREESVGQLLDGPPPELREDRPVEGGLAQLDWMCRLGRMLARRGRQSEAARQYKRVLEIYPIHAESLRGLVGISISLGEHGQGVAALRTALQRHPDDVDLLNDLAWILATCRAETVRDGAESLRLAERAIRLSQSDRWHLFDTLGAAHAELGQFEQAEGAAQRAEDLARRAGLAAKGDAIAERAALYRTREPYRE